MSNLGMAIGTAAGSIFGSLMGNKMQQDQFGNQLTLMKKQHEYNEASANAAQARAYEMWEKTNYAAQIEQMKKRKPKSWANVWTSRSRRRNGKRSARARNKSTNKHRIVTGKQIGRAHV